MPSKTQPQSSSEDIPSAYLPVFSDSLAELRALVGKRRELGIKRESSPETYSDSDREENLRLSRLCNAASDNLRLYVSSTFKQEIRKGSLDLLGSKRGLAFLKVSDMSEDLQASPYKEDLLQAIKGQVSDPGFELAPVIFEIFSKALDIETISMLSTRIMDEVEEDLLVGYTPVVQTIELLEDILLGWPSSPSDALRASRLLAISKEAMESKGYDLFRSVRAKISATQESSEKEANASKFKFEPSNSGLSPSFIREVDPRFFEQEALSRGVDLEVVNILVQDWEHDFSSLLDSAASLSAELV